MKGSSLSSGKPAISILIAARSGGDSQTEIWMVEKVRWQDKKVDREGQFGRLKKY